MYQGSHRVRESRPARCMRACLPLLLLAWLTCPAAPAAAATALRPDLAHRIDDVLNTQLFVHDIPGAAVALVGNGRVLHLGGYGHTARDAQTPVDATRTLFGTGSVSKLLTATAVMQLVEQGRLDLDRDVNDYLEGLQIPATRGEPVTLAHLLTHTAGFEERAFGFYARSPAALTDLQTFLASHLPAQVYPPGKVSAYSNYGTALAGHIVARASGIPFERYVEDSILKPLGMSHSTFRQPLPAALAGALATGYRGSDGDQGYGWYQARPAAALRASAADMARFMLAHLQQGRLGKARILRPETATAMHTRQFGNHPAVSGLTYGFQELQRAGRRILWHPGDTLYYTASLYLLPDEGLGLFIAHNRAGTRALQLDVLDTVLASLPPRWPATAAIPADTTAVAKPDGSYRSTRSGVFGLERLVAPFRTVHVRTLAPGRLHITGLAMAEDGLWIEQAPGIYHDGGGEEHVVFHADDDGTVWLFEGNVPAHGYVRLPWYAAPAVQGSLLAGCSLVFLAGLVVRPPRDRRRQRRVIAPRTLSVRLTRPVTGALCATNLAVLAGIGLILSRGHQLLFGLPPWAQAILLLPLASTALVAVTAILTAIAWRRGYWSDRGRWHMTLLTLVALLFLGLLRYWRLL